MDKKLAGLLGAAAALSAVTTAQAAPASGLELPQASSYRDLLDPIPNALPLLKADDARLAETGAVRTAQVVIGHHHHHHHHRAGDHTGYSDGCFERCVHGDPDFALQRSANPVA